MPSGRQRRHRHRDQSLTQTLAAVAAGQGPDAWITFSPLERLAVDETGVEAFEDPTALASTRLVVVSRAERDAVLVAACGGAVTWNCIGENAGQPWSSLGGDATWGDLAPGHDNPTERGAGLLTMNNARRPTSDRRRSTPWTSTPILASSAGSAGWSGLSLRSCSPPTRHSTRWPPGGRSTSSARPMPSSPDWAAPPDRFTVAYPEPVARTGAVLVNSTGRRTDPSCG